MSIPYPKLLETNVFEYMIVSSCPVSVSMLLVLLRKELYKVICVASQRNLEKATFGKHVGLLRTFVCYSVIYSHARISSIIKTQGYLVIYQVINSSTMAIPCNMPLRYQCIYAKYVITVQIIVHLFSVII